MIAHLPTVMLIIGYVVFWLELFMFRLPEGRTSFLATGLFFLIALLVVLKDSFRLVSSFKNSFLQISRLDGPQKFFMAAGFLACFSILVVAFFATLLPPHLAQESDALIYHIALPRQHLIQHSFEHIPWSTADFYLLPINFALAPYWLLTELPNKFPQFLFFIAAVAMCARLVSQFSGRIVSAMLVVLAVLGLHSVGIQAGTAMLDIAAVYLLLAALDSFLKGNLVLAGIELAFYVWSKSFIPVQCLLIVLPLFALGWLAVRREWHLSWIPGQVIPLAQAGKYLRHLKKTVIVFAVASFFIGGPFVAKSLYYVGTPLFPFFPGLVQTRAEINSETLSWQSIEQKAQEVRSTRNQYGSGRSPLEFAKHLWLIAVPEKDVNNRYDYPVGLMYLLFLVPFVVFWIQSLRDREFSLLSWFVILFWMTWWMGSHQTRFLFVPLIMMMIVVAAKMEKPSRVLMATMMIALSLTALSVVRAHQHDFGKTPAEALRDKDKSLLEMSKNVKPGKIVDLDFIDVAFAEFPVNVTNVDSVFVLQQDGSSQN